MTDKRRKNPILSDGVEDGSVPRSPDEPTTETLRKTSLTGPSGKIGDIVAVLAGVERLVNSQAENARVQATRLTEIHDDFARVVGAVRDLANTAVGVVQKIQVESLVVEADLHPVARGIILLAGIMRQLNGLSNTVAATMESQTATTQELIRIVGEATKASACLAGKMVTLAEKTRTILPALSNKNLVEAELAWLTRELRKVVAEFPPRSDGVSEAVSDITQEVPSKLQLAN